MLPGEKLEVPDIDVKLLDGKSVMCQAGGCDRPASYLLTSRDGTSLCLAQCESHAREFAAANRLTLPPAPAA